MTEGDVYDAVDRYSRQGKIASIHLRNVVGEVPNYRETFIDEGDVDMISRILSILARNKFDGSDYSRSHSSDEAARRRGTQAWRTPLDSSSRLRQCSRHPPASGQSLDLNPEGNCNRAQIFSRPSFYRGFGFSSGRLAIRLRQYCHPAAPSIIWHFVSTSMPPASAGPPDARSSDAPLALPARAR